MTEATQKSRVLTLVFTDLVDSTALKTTRGDQAVDALITRHREHVVRLAEESSGRVIDWAGDGCFLTFETSSAAVVFSLRLQQAHADEPDLPRVRIGIHLGEVTELSGPGGDVQVKGLVVDVAARISGLAKPGQVLLSTAVHNSARQRLGVETFGQPILWQAHGTYELKGFDEPMEIREAGIEGVAPLEAPKTSEKAKRVKRARRARRTRGMPKPAARTSRTYPIWAVGIIAALLVVVGLLLGREFAVAPEPPAEPEDIGAITSIAVLPFESPGSPELQHRASGLADQLSTELNKIGAFEKIIARDTVVSSGLADRSEEEIARAFGVDALLKGTVTFEGTMVSINIRLTGANGVGELWGDTFTREFENSITMIGQMALAIARELYAEVTPEEQTRLARERPVDPEAFDLYLQARSYWQQHTRDDGLIAVELLQQAIEIDPSYALAYSSLADAYVDLVNVFLSPHDAMPQARAAALEALSLDDELAEAHLALAAVSFVYDWNWKETERRVRRALELNPDLAAARIGLADLLTSTGQFEEALGEVELALQLDPYSAMVADRAAALFYITREYDRVIRHTQAQIDKYPNNPNFYLWRGAAYVKLEEFDDAIRNSLKAVELESNPITVAFLGGSYGAAGQRDKAMETLEELDRQREAGLYVCSYEVASVYASMGDTEDAFEWLERAYDERANCMPWLDADPRWDGIRDDPRFNDLLRSVGLGEYFGIEETAAAEKRIQKIAVLPFENMSSDPEQEYFVDGMTEALISELAKIKSLKIISRTSTNRYKNTDKSLTQIARELGVDALVEGSVFKAGDDVRITAQLIHGITDEHLWAGNYTSKLEDVLNLQAEVALFIAEEVHATVTPEERSRIASKKTVDPEAYGLYAQGRHFWNRRDAEGFEKARELFEQALEIDPDFLEARVGLADCYALPALHGFLDPDVGFPRAELEVLRVLAEDPTLGEAHATLGLIQLNYSWDWDAAEASLRRAIELSPNYGGAYDWYSDYLLAMGRYEESLEYDRKGLELDPLSPEQASDVGLSLMMSGQIESSITFMRETVNLYPDVPLVHLTLGDVLSTSGAFEEARRHYERAVEQTDRASLMYTIALVYNDADLGRTEEARARLEELEEEYRESGEGTVAGFAACRAYLGEWDEAFEWYEEAFRKHDFRLVNLRKGADHWLPPDFVADPRFRDLLRRMNFPER